MEYNELLQQGQDLKRQALAILRSKDSTADDLTKAANMLDEVKAIADRATKIKELTNVAMELPTEQPKPQKDAPKGFKSWGEMLVAVAQAGNIHYRGPLHPALKSFDDPDEPKGNASMGFKGWSESPEVKATMIENVGGRGGFLVPTEYIPRLYSVSPEANPVRARATIIPMRRRQVNIPVLDQTGTTSGQPCWFGGMVANWTEEQAAKTQSDPTFRQVSLVAHKLVCYTRASQELLDDEAVGLEALLRSDMGFSGAISWYEEYAFLQGTGAGQPLGIVNAGATISVAAQANPPAAASLYTDLTNMLGHLLPSSFGNAIWIANHQYLTTMLQMTGPTANPAYLWGDAVKGVPNLLLGMPVVFTEKLPAPGSDGSLLLVDLRYYLIGDRQSITVESSTAGRFQYDEVEWRAVHRVDGQPWLSTYLTLSDGADTVSPFVKLGAKST